MRNEVIGIGVIGLGHWGPNHVRVFNQTPGARVVICADPDNTRQGHVQNLYREVEIVADAQAVFSHRDVAKRTRSMDEQVIPVTCENSSGRLDRLAVDDGEPSLISDCGASELDYDQVP